MKKTTSKRSSKKPFKRSSKKPSKKNRRKINPFNHINDLGINQRIHVNGKAYTIKSFYKGKIVAFDDYAQLKIFNLEDLDEYKKEHDKKSTISDIFAANQNKLKPAYVQVRRYQFRDAPNLLKNKLELQITLFYKLNIEKKPVTKWQYAIDLEVIKTGEVISSLETPGDGYNTFEEVKNAAWKITLHRMEIKLPNSLTPVQDELVKL